MTSSWGHSLLSTGTNLSESTIVLSSNVSLPLHEIEFNAVRAQGNGGQNVNKVSSAIHLRFDVSQSSLPPFYKDRLLAIRDTRLNSDGVLVLKAQQFRTQELNKEDAIKRLTEIILNAVKTQKKRVATKPTKASKQRRLNSKKKLSSAKKLRGKVSDY